MSDDQTISALQSGKGHTDENFPVASWLVRPDARGPVMAYYHFARAADDIADNPDAPAEEKLRLLAWMRSGLEGEGDPRAQGLGKVCRERGISLAHGHDLLDAFVQDCTVGRYQDWDGLIDYCAKSAMPVGRYVRLCRLSTTCRIAARITARLTGCIFRSLCWRLSGWMSWRWARRRRGRNCWA